MANQTRLYNFTIVFSISRCVIYRKRDVEREVSKGSAEAFIVEWPAFTITKERRVVLLFYAAKSQIFFMSVESVDKNPLALHLETIIKPFQHNTTGISAKKLNPSPFLEFEMEGKIFHLMSAVKWSSRNFQVVWHIV